MFYKFQRICKFGAGEASSGFRLWHKLGWCGKKGRRWNVGKPILGHVPQNNPRSTKPLWRSVQQSKNTQTCSFDNQRKNWISFFSSSVAKRLFSQSMRECPYVSVNSRSIILTRKNDGWKYILKNNFFNVEYLVMVHLTVWIQKFWKK